MKVTLLILFLVSMQISSVFATPPTLERCSSYSPVDTVFYVKRVISADESFHFVTSASTNISYDKIGNMVTLKNAADGIKTFRVIPTAQELSLNIFGIMGNVSQQGSGPLGDFGFYGGQGRFSVSGTPNDISFEINNIKTEHTLLSDIKRESRIVNFSNKKSKSVTLEAYTLLEPINVDYVDDGNSQILASIYLDGLPVRKYELEKGKGCLYNLFNNKTIPMSSSMPVVTTVDWSRLASPSILVTVSILILLIGIGFIFLKRNNKK